MASLHATEARWPRCMRRRLDGPAACDGGSMAPLHATEAQAHFLLRTLHVLLTALCKWVNNCVGALNLKPFGAAQSLNSSAKLYC